MAGRSRPASRAFPGCWDGAWGLGGREHRPGGTGRAPGQRQARARGVRRSALVRTEVARGCGC
eukprot:578119-Prymnesium_polylepis.1